MKVCIIDDTRSTTSNFKHDVEKALEDVEVTEKWHLPEDESELDGFDVLVVDNFGIGNKDFRSGFDFLKSYAPAHPDKLIVFHTGFLGRNHFEQLGPLGVKCAEKSWNQALVIELIKSRMESKEKGKHTDMECDPKKEVRSITVEICLQPPDDTAEKFIDHMEEAYGLKVKVVDGQFPDSWVTLTGPVESLEKWFVEWFTNTDSLSVALKLWDISHFEDILDEE